LNAPNKGPIAAADLPIPPGGVYNPVQAGTTGTYLRDQTTGQPIYVIDGPEFHFLFDSDGQLEIDDPTNAFVFLKPLKTFVSDCNNVTENGGTLDESTASNLGYAKKALGQIKAKFNIQ
jgi:hypothetical protein